MIGLWGRIRISKSYPQVLRALGSIKGSWTPLLSIIPSARQMTGCLSGGGLLPGPFCHCKQWAGHIFPGTRYWELVHYMSFMQLRGNVWAILPAAMWVSDHTVEAKWVQFNQWSPWDGELYNRAAIRLCGGRELREGLMSQEDLGGSARPRETKTGALAVTLASVGRHCILLEMKSSLAMNALV